MQQLNSKPYIVGAVIGGALGATLAAIIGAVMVGAATFVTGFVELFKTMDKFAIIAIVSVIGAPIGGAAFGIFVGNVVWMRAAKIGKNPHPVKRALIGAGFMLIWQLLVAGITLAKSLFTSTKEETFRPAWETGFTLLYAVMVGISAGLLARSKNTNEAMPEAKGE